MAVGACPSNPLKYTFILEPQKPIARPRGRPRKTTSSTNELVSGPTISIGQGRPSNYSKLCNEGRYSELCYLLLNSKVQERQRLVRALEPHLVSMCFEPAATLFVKHVFSMFPRLAFRLQGSITMLAFCSPGLEVLLFMLRKGGSLQQLVTKELIQLGVYWSFKIPAAKCLWSTILSLPWYDKAAENPLRDMIHADMNGKWVSLVQDPVGGTVVLMLYEYGYLTMEDKAFGEFNAQLSACLCCLPFVLIVHGLLGEKDRDTHETLETMILSHLEACLVSPYCLVLMEKVLECASVGFLPKLMDTLRRPSNHGIPPLVSLAKTPQGPSILHLLFLTVGEQDASALVQTLREHRKTVASCEMGKSIFERCDQQELWHCVRLP